jgi:hypothetical protein
VANNGTGTTAQTSQVGMDVRCRAHQHMHTRYMDGAIHSIFAGQPPALQRPTSAAQLRQYGWVHGTRQVSFEAGAPSCQQGPW